MTRKRCLWATSQPWRAPFRVSAHHYATFLVEQGWDVAFLSHPISPLHLLHARADTGDRFANWRAGGGEDRGPRRGKVQVALVIFRWRFDSIWWFGGGWGGESRNGGSHSFR